ncbi:hypothetical protein vBKpnAMK4_00499 [Klebsiella phage vB_Kpn_AM_K4]
MGMSFSVSGGNRQAWQYVISAATAATPRWVKVATIKHPGDASSQLDLMITGGIDSGHGRHYVDFITLSGRNLTSWSTRWQYTISAATALTPRWVKVATMKHPGMASSQLDLMISGGIDSGHGKHYVDFITLSGRNLTSWSTNKGCSNVSCCFGTHQFSLDNIADKFMPFQIAGTTHVVIVLDNDKSGNEAAKKLAKLIRDKTRIIP